MQSSCFQFAILDLLFSILDSRFQFRCFNFWLWIFAVYFYGANSHFLIFNWCFFDVQCTIPILNFKFQTFNSQYSIFNFKFGISNSRFLLLLCSPCICIYTVHTGAFILVTEEVVTFFVSLAFLALTTMMYICAYIYIYIYIYK